MKLTFEVTGTEEDVKRIEVNVKKLLDYNALNMRNGKVLLHFDGDASLKGVEFSIMRKVSEIDKDKGSVTVRNEYINTKFLN